MYSSKILLLIFIFLAVYWTFVNILKAIYKESIPWGNIILMVVGIVGIVAYFI